MKKWLLLALIPFVLSLNPQEFIPIVDFGAIMNVTEVKKPLKPVGLLLGNAVWHPETGAFNMWFNFWYAW
jgi:hypothetical protein